MRSSSGDIANLRYFGNINCVHHENFIQKSDQLSMHDQHLGHPLICNLKTESSHAFLYHLRAGSVTLKLDTCVS